jgi:hypothetical protein
MECWITNDARHKNFTLIDPLAFAQLHFTSFAVASLREDSCLRDCCHSGHTNKKRPGKPGRFVRLEP